MLQLASEDSVDTGFLLSFFKFQQLLASLGQGWGELLVFYALCYGISVSVFEISELNLDGKLVILHGRPLPNTTK